MGVSEGVLVEIRDFKGYLYFVIFLKICFREVVVFRKRRFVVLFECNE